MSAADHKAEAEEFIERAFRSSSSDAEMRSIGQAEVHALLYAAEQTAELVKQQRIANLLSIASFSHDAGAGQRLYTNMEGASKWRDEAARGLGLS